MQDDFQRSPLFKDAFGGLFLKHHKANVDLLVSELNKARARVKSLLEYIPADCKSLTVHDISHIDALWEMASIANDKRITLNPAEGYVFGMAALLHDAGMTAVAFTGADQELRETQEWKDYESLLEDKLRVEGRTMPRVEMDQQVMFSTLRELHARKAEDLATQRWKSPQDSSEIFIIENEELRSAYGLSIGKIAHSHHWDIEKVLDLRERVGAAPEILPIDWYVDERKIACLLRIADICHIDRRRAPTMHYALQKPMGYSELHWRFQNKLSKPTLHEGSLVYTAGTPFKVEEADAWWLAYETVTQIGAELQKTNSALADCDVPQMGAKTASGAASVSAFSKHVQPEGWKPVDASIRVSDPSHLAASIGGRNLYGAGLLPPIRELLQNAADAIRARRALEETGLEFGHIKIVLKVEKDQLEVSIFDNGIGMSERVLAGPLIDFGKSIWGSELLRSEYPALASKHFRKIGKYGIGFFSVFDVSSKISVTSRKFNSDYSSARVLEFRGVHSRPIMRSVSISEFNPSMNTCVRFSVNDPKEFEKGATYSSLGAVSKIVADISLLISALDIDVTIVDMVSNKTVSHSADIFRKSARELLTETGHQLFNRFNDEEKIIFERLLMPIRNKDKELRGRCALNIASVLDQRRDSGSVVVAVGGFAAIAPSVSSIGLRGEISYFDIFERTPSIIDREKGRQMFRSGDDKSADAEEVRGNATIRPCLELIEGTWGERSKLSIEWAEVFKTPEPFRNGHRRVLIVSRPSP
ncbi:ATP-binding protein [Mesorhizobium sp. M0179]|uniref:HD domain-containing protein n=1 Tax=Mesorhizobium sp. M0179 TaxID=2956905 RepID=UPI0033362C5B